MLKNKKEIKKTIFLMLKRKTINKRPLVVLNYVTEKLVFATNLSVKLNLSINVKGNEGKFFFSFCCFA